MSEPEPPAGGQESASGQPSSADQPPPAEPPSRAMAREGLLSRAERAALSGIGDVHRPAWRRRTPAEPRWPVTLSVAAAIVLQVVLPDQLALLPRYLLPGLEAALLAGLIVANPVRIERRSQVVRWASIGLIVLMTAANTASAVLLVRAILTGTAGSTGLALLATGAAIWSTNVIAFALWYWEFDRGGPVHRAHGIAQFPDLMFPQMAAPELAAPGWEARFADYLYLSFTNATAFSPTDVMPLARWAKLTMLVQSAVSLTLGLLVIARAVNILQVVSIPK